MDNEWTPQAASERLSSATRDYNTAWALESPRMGGYPPEVYEAKRRWLKWSRLTSRIDLQRALHMIEQLQTELLQEKHISATLLVLLEQSEQARAGAVPPAEGGAHE